HNSVDNEILPKIVDTLLGNVVGQISSGEHHSMILSSNHYPDVSQDVWFWKILEDEEFRLKKLLLRRSPSGLKSKEIIQVEMAREKIRQKHEEKLAASQADEANMIVDRLSIIKNRDAIALEVQDGIEDRIQ
ncbi:hypothetical protein BVRB_038010, partial [Beta vulgaris subsp. vulgaris]